MVPQGYYFLIEGQSFCPIKIVTDVCKFSLPLNSVFVSVSCLCNGSISKSGFLLVFWWHLAFLMFLNKYKFCSSTLADLA